MFTTTRLMPVEGPAVRFHMSLAHDVLHGEYLGDDDENVSYSY